MGWRGKFRTVFPLPSGPRVGDLFSFQMTITKKDAGLFSNSNILVSQIANGVMKGRVWKSRFLKGKSPGQEEPQPSSPSSFLQGHGSGVLGSQALSMSTVEVTLRALEDPSISGLQHSLQGRWRATEAPAALPSWGSQ